MINAIHNAKNPYQGTDKKVLCVCSAGLLRSPTTAVVLEREYGYNTRAAGVDTDHALIPVSPQLLYWADEIVCMDEHQQLALIVMMDKAETEFAYFDLNLHNTPIHVLNVPDRYERMNPELQGIIHKAYAEVLLEQG